jgi:hypothetical protein
MMTLFMIGLWIALCSVVGVAASTRGRDGGGWFVLALVISPLIAGLLVLALPAVIKNGKPAYALSPSQVRIVRGQLTPLARICPHCESTISATAPICATCLRESTPMSKASAHQIYEKARENQKYNNMTREIGVIAIIIIFVLGMSLS